MSSLTGRLTSAEVDFLAQCEETIQAGLHTFVEVGTALASVRENRLYRAEHGTFDDYCANRWGFTDRRARQLIEAAEIGRILPVANAGQAAELARVPEEQRAEVWTETVERTDGKPTAAAIRDTAASMTPPRRDGDPIGTPGSAVTASGEAANRGEVAAVGEDAAAASPSSERKTNRRPLVDAFRDAAYDLVKVAERMERLVQDDRFPRNAEQVGQLCRADLLRAGDLLATVVDRVPNLTKEPTE